VRRPIALFFGTRPQVIKASALREALATVGPVLAVDTGQHYDYALHRVHYEQLGVRPPDAFLEVGSGTHGAQTAALLIACERWIAAQRPRAAVVIGDTNSTLGCALAAVKQRVPVAHVEAGLRAGDRLMAEDINRRAVDAVADLLCAPCERVGAALRRAYPDATVEVVGDVAYDVLLRAQGRMQAAERVCASDLFWPEGYIYVTLHRAELVDAPERLSAVVDALVRSRWPCVFPAHPRTVAALGRLDRPLNGRIRMTGPVGYLESVELLRHAAAVVTDSGGLQREAYWLGVPCVTVRSETEWIETVELGANRLVPPEAAADLPAAIESAVAQREAGAAWDRTAYGDGRAAARVAQALAEWL
jgi:UDP-N-acetylglucosamine 2-epimerase